MLVLSALSDASATVIAAVGALMGAAVGGFATYKAAVRGAELSGEAQRQQADAEAQRRAEASALLMQDDFLHYQVTLARSLDVCRWWTPAQQLPGQATFDDRKTVWAQLNGDSTTVVAGAQGWMDYLMNTRGLQPAPAAGQDAPELSPAIVRTMRDTFRLLDTGRQALATLTHRDYVTFEATFDMGDQLVNCHSTEELLDHCG
jgi:hypothetical protein